MLQLRGGATHVVEVGTYFCHQPQFAPCAFYLTAEVEVASLILGRSGDFDFLQCPFPAALPKFLHKLLAPFSCPLKAITLSEGKHALKITYQGKNKKLANSLIGIDYLTFRQTD